MEIISLSNHIIRKALQLSLNEMAVLCDIKQLSQNPKFGFWCIKSKDKMSDWLDLSRATIFNAINALEEKGYIERSDIGLRPSQFIYNLDIAQEDIALYIKNNDIELVTAKMKEMLDGQSKNYTTTVQNLDGDSIEFRLPQSKNYTQVLHIDKQLEYNLEKEKEISKEILPSVLENEKLRLEIEELKKQLIDTEKKERKISAKKKESFEPPTVEEVETYFVENGFKKESGTKAYNYYAIADWQDSKGSKVKNWKQKMQAVWFKDENKQNTSYARNTSTNPTTIVIDENGNTKQSNSEFRPFGLDNNRQEGKPLLRFVNPANVPSFGYVRPTDEVSTGE